MNLEAKALREGYLLTRVPTVTRWTLADVASGLDRAAGIVERRRISPTAASNRLANLRRMGLVEEYGKDGRELTFRMTPLGRTIFAAWASDAEA